MSGQLLTLGGVHHIVHKLSLTAAMNWNQTLVIGVVIATLSAIIAGLAAGWDAIEVILPICLTIWLLASAGWVRHHSRWPYSEDQKKVVVLGLVLSPLAGILLSQKVGLLSFLAGVAVVSIWVARGWVHAAERKIQEEGDHFRHSRNGSGD